jgi:hypothetical protein
MTQIYVRGACGLSFGLSFRHRSNILFSFKKSPGITVRLLTQVEVHHCIMLSHLQKLTCLSELSIPGCNDFHMESMDAFPDELEASYASKRKLKYSL